MIARTVYVPVRRGVQLTTGVSSVSTSEATSRPLGSKRRRSKSLQSLSHTPISEYEVPPLSCTEWLVEAPVRSDPMYGVWVRRIPWLVAIDAAWFSSRTTCCDHSSPPWRDDPPSITPRPPPPPYTPIP